MDTKAKKTSEPETKAMTIQGSDRRVTPRFRVQFRTFLTNQSTLIEHMGTILDLSVAGCRVESLVPVQHSAMMELRIYVPDLDWPLMVDEAIVQWVNDRSFGLSFVKIRQGVQDRLSWVLARLAE
jgi:PilZ domain-containing protein